MRESLPISARAALRIETASSSFWLASRRALPLDLFRVLVGALLAGHFARAREELSGVLALGIAPELARAGAALSNAAPDAWSLQPSFFDLVLLATMALSLAICFGLWPRLCAGLLFVLSVALFRSSFALTSLDDHLASVACFWLCLLPVGRTLAPTAAQRARRWGDARVEGFTCSVLAAHLLLLQCDVDLWVSYSPTGFVNPWASIAMCLVAACLLAPSRLARGAGCVGLVLLHASLSRLSGLWFAHGLLASGALLFWGELPRRAPSPPVPLSASLAAGVLALSVAFFGADKLGSGTLGLSFGQVLWDVGLFPQASGQQLARAPRVLRFSARSRPGTALQLGAHELAPGYRAELLLGYLEPAAQDPTLKESVAAAVVRRHCRAQGRAGEAGELALGAGEKRTSVAWYECSQDDAAPRVILSAAPSP